VARWPVSGTDTIAPKEACPPGSAQSRRASPTSLVCGYHTWRCRGRVATRRCSTAASARPEAIGVPQFAGEAGAREHRLCEPIVPLAVRLVHPLNIAPPECLGAGCQDDVVPAHPERGNGLVAGDVADTVAVLATIAESRMLKSTSCQ